MHRTAPMLLLLTACQAQDEQQLGSSGGSGGAGDDPAPSSNCPAGMVEVAAEGFTAVVGEVVQAEVDAYPATTIPALSLQLEPFCVAAYPLPGSSGSAWLSDGLNIGQVELLEDLLPDYGRRLCTTAELLAAAAGPNNQPYPYAFDYRQGACDGEAFTPSPMGAFVGCSSPYEARDFMVRSSWSLLDDAVREAIEPYLGEAILPADGRYAIYGGTAQRDTFFSPNNYGVHFYGPDDYSAEFPAYVTDDLRVCASLGPLDAETEEAWQAWTDDLADAGTYAALLGPGLDLSTSR